MTTRINMIERHLIEARSYVESIIFEMKCIPLSMEGDDLEVAIIEVAEGKNPDASEMDVELCKLYRRIFEEINRLYYTFGGNANVPNNTLERHTTAAQPTP